MFSQSIYFNFEKKKVDVILKKNKLRVGFLDIIRELNK